MHNKKIFVTKPFLPPINEYNSYLERIWDSNILTNEGPLLKEFEEEIKNYLKCRNVTLFVNGHAALETALKMLPVCGEVITTPFTFSSTTHAIVNTGNKPIFCDIKEENYTIDEKKVVNLITKKTSAIVAVHVFGYPCNVEIIEKIAKAYELKVIYDAAHAFGTEYNGTPISEYGDISMFSFHATKLFHTIEGGALIYKNDEYKKKFELYKNFGISSPDIVEITGINAKMNEFQAAMGLVNIKYISQIINKRRLITERYQQNMEDIKGIKMIREEKINKHNYAYLPILIDESEYGHTRDQLFEHLESNDIFARKYFYPLVTKYKCYRDEYINCDVPIAEYVSERIMTLPIYTELSLDDVDRICSVVNSLKRV